ncbi:hypothetical protein KC675_03740 [Candidatus Dojkabacteria bacterium]|jgi:hypothetical protein|uniref:Uncharacterized protein n=1 Tax=Candidatus Dojkabacteria bacterium TaxID=2099670 RepID=A0A955I8C4_9BACT|nr:hypothetical protein [Candidatus Dojkabacteria bacterium]
MKDSNFDRSTLKPQVQETKTSSTPYNLGCVAMATPLGLGVANAFRSLVTGFEPGVGYTGQAEAGLSIIGGVFGSALIYGIGLLIERGRS